MSYQEKTVTVYLMNMVVIFGFYSINLLQMIQRGTLNSLDVFSLWGTVIVASLIANIVSHIFTNIVYGIVHFIRTNKEESYIEDERDKLIGLKGTRNAYGVFGIGVFLSMGTQVLNMPPLVMFNLLVFSGLLAEMVGALSQLYLYRRGV